PMEDGPMRDDIIAMAEADNVPADDVFVFDQSRQHDRISANVSGLFGTMRISLNDNLLERTTPEEVKAVMGHEIGHYVLSHVWIIVGVMALVLGLGFYIASRLVPPFLARHGAKWGVRDIEDPAVTPLLFAIIGVYFMLMTPVTNTLIRWNESAADIYGLNAAQEPDGFARVAMRLSEYRKIEPSALEEFIFFDHPSGRTRVRMAMDWKAENVENPQMVIPAAAHEE
ncbi:MAG: M48 family metalloprotease, partial [Sphingomonadaceae bacterium]|nr:M48 family metalloprotease [Sphingomonadaceae bacterium]